MEIGIADAKGLSSEAGEGGSKTNRGGSWITKLFGKTKRDRRLAENDKARR